MIQSITKYEFDKLIDDTLKMSSKKEEYNISLPVYGLDMITGKETVSSHKTIANKVFENGNERFVFFNEYANSDYVLCSAEDLDEAPSLKSITTLDDIEKEQENETIQKFIQKKKSEHIRKEVKDQQNRDFTFSRMEAIQKNLNRIKQLKLHSMHDLGFYPSIEINSNEDTGIINLELTDNSNVIIPFNLMLSEDSDLTTNDFEDTPILVIDMDDLSNNSNYHQYLSSNSDLKDILESVHFLNRNDFNQIYKSGEYSTKETIRQLDDFNVVCEDNIKEFLATEYSSTLDQKNNKKQELKSKFKRL